MVRKVCFVLEKIAFWGMFFLIVLIMLFNVPLNGLVNDITSVDIPLNFISLYLLVSTPLFVLFAILNILLSHKDGLGVVETIAIDIFPLVWIPYKGLDFGDFFKLKKMPFSLVISTLWIMFQRIIEMVLWWGVLLYAIFLTMATPNCATAVSITVFGRNELLYKAGLVALIIVILNVLGWVILKAQARIWRNQSSRSVRTTNGTSRHHYYSGHMPSGCRACGGPYPKCKSSCKLYDD